MAGEAYQEISKRSVKCVQTDLVKLLQNITTLKENILFMSSYLVIIHLKAKHSLHDSYIEVLYHFRDTCQSEAKTNYIITHLKLKAINISGN